MLHKGCRQVERAELRDIPVPEARGRHRPVPHHVLAETVVGTAERLGLALQKESWGLASDGMRLYGALGIDATAYGLVNAVARARGRLHYDGRSQNDGNK